MAAGIKASADGLYGTLQVNSADVVTFNNSGNVGIGTLAPTARLQLSSTGNPGLVFDGTNQGTDLKRIRLVTQIAAAGDFAIQSMNDAGSVKSTNLYINASGSVGVGTSSPSTALQVNGTVTATLFSGSGASLTSLPAPTTAQVMSAIAASALNDVGSYAFARKVVNANPQTANQNTAGTDLRYSDTGNNASGPVINVGTWRCLGHQSFGDRTVLWLRIS